MKATMLLLLCFLLFSFSPNLLPNAAAEPVLDVDGNELQPGVRYHIVSAIIGPGGGGLRVRSGGILPCPLFLYQSPSDLDRGNAFTFQLIPRHAGPIQNGTDLVNIRSDYSLFCLQDTWWTVSSNEDSDTGAYLINIANSDPSRFSIVSGFGPYSYTLVHVGLDGHTSDIGVYYDDNGRRRLGLTTERPFYVVFEKADSYLKIKTNVKQM